MSSQLLPPSTQLQPPESDQTNTGEVRAHTSVARQPCTSTGNIFRSLSTIHRSASILPASLVDFDAVSAAGLHVIRPETHPEAFVPIPPDGEWGWIVVMAAFITNLVIDGICVSFGIMAAEFAEHFEAAMATVMLTGSLLLGVYQMIGPVAASLVNKFGCRAVGIGGALTATLAMFASAFMPTIELMLVSYGIIAGAAFGLLHLPSIICVSFYFDTRRALAIGVTSCGTPIGAMVFAPLTEILLAKYGWSNTLILFAGMLLNCAVLATLYRPLVPALLLTPMKAADNEAIKSLLQIAMSNAPETDGTSPLTSQRDLRDLPLIKEPKEGEKDDAELAADVATEFPSPQLAPISESPEGEIDADEQGTAATNGKTLVTGEKKPFKPFHHRYHRRRKAACETPSSREPKEPKARRVSVEGGGTDEADYSGASTCGSSCEEEVSHWNSSDEETKIREASNAVADAVAQDNEARDVLRPLMETKSHRHRVVSTGTRIRQAPYRSVSTSECTLSTPCIERISGHLAPSKLPREFSRRTRLSECQPSRIYSKPIPRQSVCQMAYAGVPRVRAESVAVFALTRGRPSALGSQLFASSASGIADADRVGVSSLEEVADSGVPVVVELPHESITVEDYARPLYRKDIFFQGSVKCRTEAPASSFPSTTITPACTVDTSNEHIGGSKISVAMLDGRSRRKITGQFGSNILFGDSILLPPTNELTLPEKDAPGEDINWTGSCLMSLTKIPLPDVFETVGGDAGVSGDNDDDDAALPLGQLKGETGLVDVPSDGIYRVPRSSTLCGWWMCWETRRVSVGESGCTDEIEQFKALKEDGDRSHTSKFPHHTQMVLLRKCQFMPKSMCDVLVTMTNLSLFKSKTFSLFCLSSLIAVMGLYVPLFFVCDLADSFGIPKSQSAYILSVYGGASVVSRLFSSWVAGRPNVSALVVATATLFLAGAVVCVLPYWGSLLGQMVIMVAFGLTISPFLSLTSIIICDLLDLEALTNAYGIVTLVRGIASTIGSPVAGMIVSATGNFSSALLISGATIVIGAIIYVGIIFRETAKLNKLLRNEIDCEQNKN